MTKTYIDIPVVGYETWVFSSYYIDGDAKSVIYDNIEDPVSFEDLHKRFPHSPENRHVK